MKKFDIVVIGAGPIGSFTAYQLADRRFKVCLLEKKKEIGTGVICAGVVSKEAFRRFDLPSKSILGRFNSIVFVSPKGQRLVYKADDNFAYVLDRRIFDKGISTMAQRLGVETFCGERVIDIDDSNDNYIVRTRKRKFQAKAVVLATGINYELHKKIGLGKPQSFLYGFQVSAQLFIPEEQITIHIGQNFAPGSFAWVVPAGFENARIGMLGYNRQKEWLNKFMIERLNLNNKNIKNRIKVKPIAYGPIDKSVKNMVLAVGEAAGQIKTTTGGGIFYGLLCSEIAVNKLTRALKSHYNLADYELTWRTTLKSEFDIGRYIRDIARTLNDDTIERFFTFVKKNRIWVNFLLPRINFDFHSNFLFFCLQSFKSLFF